MALPKPFDGYVEQPAGVTTTALIHLQRNRYSTPTFSCKKCVLHCPVIRQDDERKQQLIQ